MAVKRSLDEISDVTGATDDNGMAMALSKMENIMVGKKQKKSQKIGELHTNLMNKVKDELYCISDMCGNTREESHNALIAMVKGIKTTGAELTDIEQTLYQKYQEMEDCAKVLADVGRVFDHVQESKQQLEYDHRSAVHASYKKLKTDIEQVLNDCMKGLAKNYEATSQMKKMRAFLHQLEASQ
eukprot:TRINITY_DN7231_c0_g1_i1.p1 TRINITY_DN7231_c0_g1~~TRINITY_DN7231_c0_g1_i1.p1  ORF type:complete len:184 (+),score=62.24 TRINITY_DN7231_c0_g1_i1:55-606(+)